MSIKINLLKNPPPGKRRAEIVLDLDPDVFSRRHLHEVRIALASFLSVEIDEIALVSVARWKPILEIDLPAESAVAVVEAFEKKDSLLKDAFGIIRPLSIVLEELPPDPLAQVEPADAVPESELVLERTVVKSAPRFGLWRLLRVGLSMLSLFVLMFLIQNPQVAVQGAGMLIGFVLPIIALVSLAARLTPQGDAS